LIYRRDLYILPHRQNALAHSAVGYLEKAQTVNSLLNLLSLLDDLEAYGRDFMDVRGWRPYVRTVCLRHRLLPCQAVRAGVAGSYPTFIVDERWVVKFFGRLFDGELAFATEREAARLLARDGSFPVPRLAAQGYLQALPVLAGKDAHLPPDSRLQPDATAIYGPAKASAKAPNPVKGDSAFLQPGETDWPWPYLIYEFLPGVSLGEVYPLIAFDDHLALAHDLGKLARRLHRLPLDDSPLFRPTWDAYLEYMRSQAGRCVENHRRWGLLPERLVGQIEAFLLPPEQLLDTDLPPHWIHADLTRDHLLGQLDGGHWQTSGLIDFGDARIGSLYYELVALHLALFAGDPRLLNAFLLAYGPEEADRPDFSRRAMSTTLLHQFNVLECIQLTRPSLFQVETLQEMADLLWKG